MTISHVDEDILVYALLLNQIFLACTSSFEIALHYLVSSLTARKFTFVFENAIIVLK